jgi:hypothetical protein
MRKIFLFFLAVAAIGLVASGGQSSTNSAPDGECFVCHTNTADSADVKIIGIPKEYEPGKTYHITLSVFSRLKSMSEIQGGFSATASIGDLIVTDKKNTQKSNSFITHTIEGAKSRLWKFAWKAPKEKTDAEIRVMAIAANGDYSSSGDAMTADIIAIKGKK